MGKGGNRYNGPCWERKDVAIREGHREGVEGRVVFRLDLGLVPYHQAWGLQKELVACKRTQEDTPEVLLLLEHPPVLTLGRFGRPEHLLADAARLKELGLELVRCERGGQVTYHGPGQLIAYPILNLTHLGLGIREVVRRLEAVVIRTLADYRVPAARRPGYPGVWVGEEKIASLGLAIQQNISFHGLALNYGACLDPFDLINPCGLAGVRMTSLEKIKGCRPGSAELRHGLAGHFMEVFGLKPGTPGPLEKIVEKWLENCKIKPI